MGNNMENTTNAPATVQPSASAIVTAPETYGFVWTTGAVEKNGRQLRAAAPMVRVENVTLFDNAFPGVILAAANGTSIRVAVQAVIRNTLDKNATAKDDDLKVRIVNSVLLRNRTREVVTRTVEKAVYTDAKGRQFDSIEALKAAEVADKADALAAMVDAGLPLATAKQILGIE